MAALADFFSSMGGRILIALVVPVAWGLLSAWLFERLRPTDKAGAPTRQGRRDRQ